MGEARQFLGLDGGATRCRARLRDKSGEMLAEDLGPAVNVYVDFAAGLSGMADLAMRVIKTAGLHISAQQDTALGIGLAGLSTAQDARRIAAALAGWARVEAVNDAVAACIGANGLGDGGLIIAGTGTAGIARVGGQATIVGGRGFLVGDDGAGARIGADALRAALRAHDGLEPSSELSRSLMGAFDNDPYALTRWALTAKPGDYGAFAPRVFAAAEAGEPQALRIVERAAAAIEALARRVGELGAPQIAFVGGVAEPLRRYLAPGLSARLRPPRHDATDGAILLVGGAIANERDLS